jgi:high-affinity K+ transport system ATPase subunit B
MPGVSEHELADAAQLSSFSDETPEGRSIVVLAKDSLTPMRCSPGHDILLGLSNRRPPTSSRCREDH